MEPIVVEVDDLLHRAETLYRFVALFTDYENTVRDYGEKHKMTMTEVHTLVAIEANPGISATELADRFFCSKSAVSQLLSKLERSGYILRITDQSNSKKKQVFVTQVGKHICDLHRAFDVKALTKIYRYLLRSCSEEDISTFYHVMKIYNNIMDSAYRKRKASATAKKKTFSL